MKKYQVVIQQHCVYEVEADSYEDAEDMAWDRFEPDHMSEPLTADILIIEEERV